MKNQKKETHKTEVNVVKLLAKKGLPVKLERIAIALGMNDTYTDYKKLYSVIASLVKEGVLKKTAIGVYAIKNQGVFNRAKMYAKAKKAEQALKAPISRFDVSTSAPKLRHLSPLEVFFATKPQAMTKYYKALKSKVAIRFLNLDLDKLQNATTFVSDCFNTKTSIDDACTMIGLQDTNKELRFNANLLLNFHNSLTDNPSVPIKSDAVNSPSHYTDGKIEVIDYIEDKAFGFHLGNVVKYVSRAGKKNASTKVQDLEKARWYLDRIINNLKNPK